ncbi:MAG: leucine-rich repeat domain-containing protein [Eubacteriales bacterium]|nr:leucine-rich repeat domain-containing protein [Eubacteriales bacterium]
METPAFPGRERRKPSRRLIFFLAAVIAALLLGVVAMAILRPVGEGAYEENMAKAAEAYDQGDWDNALRYLRRAASYEETDECRKRMAACYEQTGMLDKALEYLRMVDSADTWASERILQIEQKKAMEKTADTVQVLGALLPPDARDLVLDGRGLRDEDLQEIVRLYALDTLSLSDNRIRDFSALTQLGSLDVLDLSGNQISDLSPLNKMSGLRALYLDRNPLDDLMPLYGLQNLNTLSIQGCGIGEEQLATLAEALPACAILSDAPEEDVSDISLGGLTFRSDVEELDLSGRGVRDISVLAACKELRRLDLSGNEISDLQGLMNLPHLSQLNIASNQIGDLRPLMGIETLRRLNAAENVLTDTAAFSAMTALQELDLSGNPLSDYSGLRHLTNLTMLTKLVLDENPELSNDAYGLLKSSLPSCSISHTELIYTIHIDGQPVLSNVTHLDLSGKGIVDLSGLERLNYLTSLDLSRNQIGNLYVMQIIASRESLQELNLAFNQLTSVNELIGLTALESLNLYANPLQSIQTLKSMTWLRWLNVGSCGLSEEQLSELQNALPNCVIELEA